jgi:outer membrane protein OmpA-like peptidoglycan-associated protein
MSDERILFETGKSDITNNGQVFIDRVAKIIRDKTKANVSIEGHTDNVGSQDLNQRLSERRAASVMQALTAKGVARSRVTMKGYGMTKPVADNGTPDGRQANRRTEIIVLGENAENLGGTSLADSLSEGLDRFLKNAGEFIQSAFGNKE